MHGSLHFKKKMSYTELESQVLIHHEITTSIQHGGKKAIAKCKFLSDNTTQSADLLKQLLEKTYFYGVQLNGTVDV